MHSHQAILLRPFLSTHLLKTAPIKSYKGVEGWRSRKDNILVHVHSLQGSKVMFPIYLSTKIMNSHQAILLRPFLSTHLLKTAPIKSYKGVEGWRSRKDNILVHVHSLQGSKVMFPIYLSTKKCIHTRLSCWDPSPPPILSKLTGPFQQNQTHKITRGDLQQVPLKAHESRHFLLDVPCWAEPIMKRKLPSRHQAILGSGTIGSTTKCIGLNLSNGEQNVRNSLECVGSRKPPTQLLEKNENWKISKYSRMTVKPPRGRSYCRVR